MSDYYGISGLKEAQDYMADEFCQPSLGKLLNIKLKKRMILNNGYGH